MSEMDRQAALRLFEEALSAAREEDGLGEDRWAMMRAYAEALKEIGVDDELMFRAGGPVQLVRNCMMLMLEQFPEAPPLDEESVHGYSVHELLKSMSELLLRDLDARSGTRYIYRPRG
jgi:hypothetical protein